MKISEFVEYLKTNFSTTKFYNGVINKNDLECVGVFRRDASISRIALGGLDNTSYNTLPVSLLVHWTENSNSCEEKALELYDFLNGKSNFYINSRRIISIDILNSGPIDIGRDDKNISEFIIRLNILYERV